MTTQYNVVTYGNLTNNNGVLSGFSASNYATLPLNFNPTLLYYDIVFKFNTANVSQEQVLFMVYNANNYTFPVVNIEIFNSALYFETTSGEVQYAEIIGITTLSSNTDYWVKVNRNGNTYTLYLSTDGTTFVSEGTYTTNSHPPLDNYKSLIGLYYSSIDGFKLPFDGGIDLNESYINIDNIRWWQGVTVTSNVRTRIQLRHDTAANWTSVNPVLLDGEVGIETDTRKQKIGDGSTAWNSLPYDVGSTALQSITSSNVTTALGYTPVNKAGDTMSGALSFTKIGGGVISLNAISEGGYSDIQYKMPNDLRVGFVRASNVSATERNLQISVCNNSGSPTSNFILRCNNDVASCTFPNTTCCDGQWVYSYSFLTNSVATTKTTISLSSYLPNDNYKYEVMGVFGRDNVNSADKYLVSSDLFNPQFNTTSGQFCVSFVAGAYARANNTSFILPVGAGRCLYTIGSQANTGNMYLYVLGYRRIGTNS